MLTQTNINEIVSLHVGSQWLVTKVWIFAINWMKIIRAVLWIPSLFRISIEWIAKLLEIVYVLCYRLSVAFLLFSFVFYGICNNSRHNTRTTTTTTEIDNLVFVIRWNIYVTLFHSIFQSNNSYFFSFFFFFVFVLISCETNFTIANIMKSIKWNAQRKKQKTHAIDNLLISE